MLESTTTTSVEYVGTNFRFVGRIEVAIAINSVLKTAKLRRETYVHLAQNMLHWRKQMNAFSS
jgi:hypothetical protein